MRVLACAGAAAAITVVAGVAAAAPGSPGVPADPVVLWHEDFSTGMSGGEVSILDAYDGGTYAADTFWANPANGNGMVIDGTSSNADMLAAGYNDGTPGGEGYSNLRLLATELGQFNGTATASSNHAVTAYTAANGADNLIEFQTVDPTTLPANGRFLTVSANVAALNCVRGAAKPELFFYLVDGSDETQVNDTAANACNGASSDDAYATNLIGGRAALFTGDQVGLIIRNAQGNGSGNDHAYDDIRILDVTPQLDKVFTDEDASQDEPLAAGSVTNLVLTVTNTSELGNKSGWNFVDHLPKGLTVAGDPITDCTADIAAPNGATIVDIANGVLAAGQASCSITVPVTSAKGGTFENSAANIESVGLNAPGATTVVFAAPPKDPAAPDTGAEPAPMWPAYGALGAGLLLAMGLGAREVLGRRES